jgi:rhomboid family GlyGly-CTERM serine protease
MTSANISWIAVATLFAVLALLGWPLPHHQLDWQPALAYSQPWRAFTAVGVHYSLHHLLANLAGMTVAGIFGIAAQVPMRLAGMWLLAWPLTHWGLLVKPELAHYGGLSGVVHAGVAAIIVHVLVTGNRQQRWVGSAVLVGFCSKLFSETPWGAALRYPADWDIAVAPIAHATGAVAGTLCALAACVLYRPKRGPSDRNRTCI